MIIIKMVLDYEVSASTATIVQREHYAFLSAFDYLINLEKLINKSLNNK